MLHPTLGRLDGKQPAAAKSFFPWDAVEFRRHQYRISRSASQTRLIDQVQVSNRKRDNRSKINM